MTTSNDRILGTWIFSPAPSMSVSMSFSADGKIVSAFKQGDALDRKEGTFSVVSSEGNVVTVDGTMDGNTKRVLITLSSDGTSAQFSGLGPQPLDMKKQ